MVEVKRNPRGTTYTVLHAAKYDIAGKMGSAQVFGLTQAEKYDEKTVARSCLIYCLRIRGSAIHRSDGGGRKRRPRQ
jgi:hypothetical protein